MPKGGTPNDAVVSDKPARVIGRPFKKGVSGNPGGRAAVSAPIKALARVYTEQALDTLVASLKAKRVADRITAADLILSRAWGRPSQHIEMEAGDELARYLDAAWRRRLKTIDAQDYEEAPAESNNVAWPKLPSQ